MLLLAWRGVRHNPARYIATLVAIITGVGFFAATGFLSDRVIDSLEGDVNRQYGNVDAAIIRDSSSADSAFLEQQRISGEVADEMASADGVEAAAGILTGSVAFLDAEGGTYGSNAIGRLWIQDGALNPVDLVEGSAPAASGEIVVDQGLASDGDLAVGDSAILLTLAGQVDVRVVGISRFGQSDSIDSGGNVFLSSEDAFTWLNSGHVEYETLYLRSDLSQAELVATLAPLAPDGFRVQAGDEFLADQRDTIGATGRYLKQALQAFAVLAMLVGGFVIYNTFSVIVTQRTRELAVMAAIGSTPKQIRSSLLYEGIVIGVLGSVLGIVAGFGLTFILIEVLQAVGVSLPGSGIKITPESVINGVSLGTIITVVSVMVPARRASRTEPVEAMRAAAAEVTSISRTRLVLTTALIGLGAAGLLFSGRLPIIAASTLALLVGVITAGPVFAVVGARLARPVFSLLGLEGRLAVDNTARNPQRTATTSNALLIGVFLVTLVLVAGTSLKDFVVGEIRELESADYLIESVGGSIDDALVSDLVAIDNVETVTPFRREAVTVDGVPGMLSTGDISALADHARLDAREGSLDDLKAGTIALVASIGAQSSPQLGSTVQVADNTGDTLELEVVAILDESIDTFATGNLVNTETFDSLVGDTAPTLAFVDIAAGAQTDTEDAIEDLTSLRPDITLTKGNALGRLIGSIFDFVINATTGLLGMSVVIALIGIVNTLSLSIIERRRELGLLRALGMTDKRVRAMVRLESVVIGAQGTITGMLLGLFLGWSLILGINRATGAEISLALPMTMLLLVIVLGPLLGLVASIVPAWRSTRLEVLESLDAT